MKSSGQEIPDPEKRSSHFATTQWRTILAAADPGESQNQALEQLCQTYWYPLYAFIRRRGTPPDEAQDLTQEFFARLIEKKWLEGITQDAGRFRSFLLTALKRFLANDYDYKQAARRGGGKQIVSLDEEGAEARYSAEPATNESPEMIFDRRWALTLLDQALQRLQQETIQGGKSRLFETLSPFLSREANDGEYTAIAQELGISAGAVGVSVHRLRHRYRSVVEDEIRSTLCDPSQLEDEMRHLFSALRGGPS